MSLPTIASPKFTVKLPSNDREIRFRPFTVKEEKVLLIASESKDTKTMMQAMVDVASACIEDGVDVSKLPYFDVEYLFLNLRAKSVGEKAKLEYRHKNGVNYSGIKCEKVTPVEIDLESVRVDETDARATKVQLTDKYSVVLRYPTLSDIAGLSTVDKAELDLIAKCLVCVYDDNEVFEPDDLNDAKKFIESLNAQQFKRVAEFFEYMPKLKHTISHKCAECGQEDVIILEGIADFF